MDIEKIGYFIEIEVSLFLWGSSKIELFGLRIFFFCI